jgi:hypothetical protein
MTTWEALNPFGEVVRTFNTSDLAEAYQERMAKIGTAITLRKRATRTIWREDRRAAA